MFSEQGIPIKALIARKGPDDTRDLGGTQGPHPRGGCRCPRLSWAARMLYWFFVYGLLGWCLEVMFAAVKERRLVNRGFLCGPICPIYGFGMVALLLAVRALGDPGGLAGAALTFVTAWCWPPWWSW